MNAPSRITRAPAAAARIASTAELAELIRPFVGAKAFPKRDPNSLYGGYLPQSSSVDILAVSHSINADVRSVTEEGVEVFFDNRCEFKSWSSIQRVTIRALDADGNTTGRTVFEHDASPAVLPPSFRDRFVDQWRGK